MKKKAITIDPSIAQRIPYSRCCEEEGMIIVGEDKYTRMYAISGVKAEQLANYDPATAHNRMETLLNGFPMDVSMQFVVHNNLVNADSFLQKILSKPEEMEEPLKGIAEAYNRVLIDNADVGHNNVSKTVYFVLAIREKVIDDAVERFKELDKTVNMLFANLYGIKARPLTLTERLKVLYSMYNPRLAGFGKKIDLDGSGNIDLKNLRYMKLTTKDLVAPESWNTSNSLIDYSILNEKAGKPQYARAFFVSMIPSKVSPSFVTDLTSVSSSMIFSIIYEPVDAEFGFEQATEAVKKNTIVTRQAKRDTLMERKNRTFKKIEETKVQTEEAYLERTALKVFQEAVNRSQKLFSCSITVVLYNDDLDALDKDSALLRLSAMKFSSSINSMDLQQCQGFQTSLPLCTSRVDTSRILDIPRLADMSPISIQDAIRRGGLYCGLNAINDTLVLLNRRNNTNLNGVICGTEHSGKTYQCKREIVNAVLSSRTNEATKNDFFQIVTTTDEYDDFARKLGGKVVDFALPDIFQVEEGYGLTEEDIVFKSYFLEAIFTSLQHFSDDYHGEEAEAKAREVEEEVSRFLHAYKEQGIKTGRDAAAYIDSHMSDFPYIVHGLNILQNSYSTMMPESDAKITVIKVKDTPETLMALDYLWNKTIRDKKLNRSNWIFIDPVDGMLEETQSADYFLKYQQNSSLFQTIVTAVVQSTASMIAYPGSAIAFETMVQGSGYIKLLNQGPKERKRLADVLGIPNALISYVSNVEPGKGIVITPDSNIPFTDNATELYPDSVFKTLFVKEIGQIEF